MKLEFKNRAARIAVVALPFALFAGCRGIAPPAERDARHQFSSVNSAYRPDGRKPQLPLLTTNSALNDFLIFAMLNQPQVEAAFYDWNASVERITIERSRPDPQLTFETYIANTIISLMPGLMLDIPGPGKLGVRAEAASAESRAKYFAFESTVLQAAFAVKSSYYPLAYLDEKIRVNHLRLDQLADLEQLARSQNQVGKATLQDVLRAQIEQEQLQVEIANLEDSRHLLTTRFKAALGLFPNDPDPPLPKLPPPAPDAFEEDLLDIALAHNPRLKAMEAEIRAADAQIRIARKDKIPDFTAGFEADVKASPIVWNPQFSMTLPIWRDKLAAEMAAAQAGKRAAEARLTAEQISVAVDFIEKTHMVREANRELTSLRDRLVPRAGQSLELARTGYVSGQLDFLNVIDAERTLFDLQLDEIAMQTQRETALAELSLVIAGIAPADAPLAKAPH